MCKGVVYKKWGASGWVIGIWIQDSNKQKVWECEYPIGQVDPKTSLYLGIQDLFSELHSREIKEVTLVCSDRIVLSSIQKQPKNGVYCARILSIQNLFSQFDTVKFMPINRPCLLKIYS